MKQIRQGVFETNSSSMHTVTLTNHQLESDYLLEIDEETNKIVAHFGEFGWGYDEYTDAEHKLSYLVTMIAENSNTIDEFYNSEDFKDVEAAICNITNRDGLMASKDQYSSDVYLNGNPCFEFEGYIDHQSIYRSIHDFLDDNHVDSIEDFIFNPNIKLVISNDNCY